MTRRTSAYINLQALSHNLAMLKAISPASKSIAVVKADAYGNGSVQIARHIESQVDILAVAFLDEALRLRESAITKPILVLQGPHEAAELEHTFSDDLLWMFHDYSQLEWLKDFVHATPSLIKHPLKENASEQPTKPSEAVSAIGRHIWLKFDTGMHRLGFHIQDLEKTTNSLKLLLSKQSVIATHLACADEADPEHTQAQIKTFLAQLNTLDYACSIANSAGSIAHFDARQDYNRLGIALYGSSPFASKSDVSNMPDLKPVMSLRAPIIALRDIPKGDSVGYGATWTAKRDTKIATVAIGYADGYPRHAPSSTPAFCNGQRIGLVGRVSMDMLTFDVTDLKEVSVFDDVELWGEAISINEVADFVGTIGYELMTRISARVPRIYDAQRQDI